MNNFRTIAASISALARAHDVNRDHTMPLPFITITRQAGCGGIQLMHLLLNRLRQRDPGEPPWTGWHKELVERVARDYQLHRSLVELLCDRDHSLLSELLISLGDQANREESELAIQHRVAETCRALAQQGKAILVGRGSVFVTRDMPAGLHIYLVAPRTHRIDQYARTHQLSQEKATEQIDRIDHNRAVFYRRHFRNMPLTPDLFDVTINTNSVSEAKMVDLILPLVPAIRTTSPASPKKPAPPVQPTIVRSEPIGLKSGDRINT